MSDVEGRRTESGVRWVRALYFIPQRRLILCVPVVRAGVITAFVSQKRSEKIGICCPNSDAAKDILHFQLFVTSFAALPKIRKSHAGHPAHRGKLAL